MADDLAIGRALIIPQSVLNNLNKVDAKINQIASDSEKMATHFTSAMTRMDNSTNGLIQKLQTIQNLVGGIGNINTSGLNNVNSGLGKTTTEAEKVANAVTEAAVALNRFSKTWQELGGKPQVAKSFEILTNREQLNVLKEARNEADAYSRSLTEANKKNVATSREATNAIKEQMQAEKNRHQESIARLKQEGSSVRINSSAYRDYVSAITMSEQTETSRLKKIERMSTVLGELKRNESAYAGEIEVLTRKINSLTKENERLAIAREKASKQLEKQSKLDSRLRRLNYQSYVTSTEGSLRTADKATTYNQRARAIKNLEAAIKNLRKTDEDYQKNLTRLSNAHKRLSEEQRKVESNYKSIKASQSGLLNTSDQLMRKLALVFSVSQIQGYVMNLAKIRGEFELQNTALASILQNKDKADKLFGQITELAVKSPFTLKELVTYTKSLSAYQVEYEKLYDTTKMLADVSAGLGVDMQRLILAFGQVKAANFLRGTEVRQFTEAGLNVLGELAKYYSELEGRMISVGEVQELVTKRMVSFGDVEEVFRRVTSAGGIFYNMQERQAETLAGMMSNLQDSIDIMLNDIGKGNDTTIKSIVKNIRTIVENWREVAWYLEKVAYGFVGYKAAVMLATLGNNKYVASLIPINKNIDKLNIKIKGLAKGMRLLGSITQGLVAGGALLLVSWLFDLWRQATKTSRAIAELEKSLDGILSADVSNLEKTVSALDDLIARFKLSNEGSQERRDIISSLNSNYGEYLDFVVDETTSLKDLTAAYDGVIKKMKEKAAVQTLEKGYQEINKTYQNELIDAREDFEKELSKVLTTDLGFGGFKKAIKPTKDELNDLFNIVQSRIRELDSDLIDSSQEQRKLLKDIVNEYYGGNVQVSQDYLKTIPLIDIFLQKKEQEEKLEQNINSAYKDTLRTREANLRMAKLEEDFNKKKKDIQSTKMSSFETKKALENATTQFELDKIELQLDLKLISKEEAERQKNAIINWATSTVKDVNERLRKELSMYSDEDLSKVLIGKEEQATGLTAIQKNVKEQYWAQVAIIKQLTGLKEKGISIDEKLLANAEKLKVLYEKKAEILDVELDKKKESGSTDNSALKILKEQIALIKKAGEEYKKLRKYRGEEDANDAIRKSFGDAFSELSLSMDMTFDTSGIIDGIRSINHNLAEEGKKVIEQAVAPLESEREINLSVKGLDDIQKKVDNIFTNYEFTLEMKTAGIDPDAFRNILKDVGASDEDISVMGFDIKDFEDLQYKIREVIYQLQKQGGTESLKLAQKYQEQLTALEVKEAKKRFSELSSLREKYRSNDDKISKLTNEMIDWQQELDFIRSLADETKKEQEELLELKIKNAEDTIRQLESEALQLTSFWQKLFGDLNDISVRSLLELSRITNEILANRQEIKGDSGETKGYTSSYTDANGISKQVTLTKQQYQQLLKQNNQVADEIQKKNPFLALWDAIKKGKNAGESQLDYYIRLDSILKDVSNTAGQVADNFAEIFNANDDTKELINNLKTVVDGSTDIGIGAARIASGDIIGGGLQAINGVSKVISAINKIHDNKREKEIQRQIDLVENLEKKYEDLKDAIDAAYSFDTLTASTKQMNKNLEAQNKALDAMIAAEEDKKKTDKDRIQEWYDQIEANNKQMQENNKELVESLGGLGTDANVQSAAEEFAQAWLDSFLKVGDGMEGLKEQMQNLMNQAIQKQLLTRLSEQYITPILNEFDKMFSEYGAGGQAMTAQELAAWQKLYETKSEQFNAAAEAYINALKQAGVDIGGTTTDEEMSGLSRSISGITEDTADALASITESIRFFASDSNMQLRNIYNWLINPPVESPLYIEIREQTNQLRMIYNMFNSIIKSVPNGGKAMQIKMM